MVLLTQSFRLISLPIFIFLLVSATIASETHPVNVMDYERGKDHNGRHSPGRQHNGGVKVYCPAHCTFENHNGNLDCSKDCDHEWCYKACLVKDNEGHIVCNKDCNSNEARRHRSYATIVISVLAILLVLVTTALCIQCCRSRRHRRYAQLQNSPFPQPNIQTYPAPIYISQRQQIPPAMPVSQHDVRYGSLVPSAPTY